MDGSVSDPRGAGTMVPMRERDVTLFCFLAAVTACTGTLPAGSQGTEGTGTSTTASTGTGTTGTTTAGTTTDSTGTTTAGTSAGTSGTSTGTAGSSGGGSSTGGGGVCGGEALMVSGEGNPLASGNTAAGMASNHVDPSCGTVDTNDDLFLWSSQAAGFYRFDTDGSQFDTVLAAFDPMDCATELACNDNDPDLLAGASSLVRYADFGEEIVLAVDGKAAAGNYRLNVARLECPSEVVPTPLDGAMDGGNTGTLDSHTMGLCGGDGLADKGHVLTADAPGFYAIEAKPTQGADALALDLVDGISCEPSTTCSTSASLPSAPARVGRVLAQGESVTAVVDGVSGDGIDYTLRVFTMACPSESLTNADFGTPHEFALPGALPTLGASCVGPGYGAHAMGFQAQIEGGYEFKVQCDLPFVLYVLDGPGDCTGAELDCKVAQANTSATFARMLNAGESVTLVVELTDPPGIIAGNCSVELGVVVT